MHELQDQLLQLKVALDTGYDPAPAAPTLFIRVFNQGLPR